MTGRSSAQVNDWSWSVSADHPSLILVVRDPCAHGHPPGGGRGRDRKVSNRDDAGDRGVTPSQRHIIYHHFGDGAKAVGHRRVGGASAQ
ncbi:hypothetical protein QF002_000924 [Paraburkholderia youngii]